jgi:hypothetical protein
VPGSIRPPLPPCISVLLGWGSNTTYAILQQPAPTLITKLAMENRSGPVIGFMDLDAIVSLRHGVAGLGNLGRDAERSTCKFLRTQKKTRRISIHHKSIDKCHSARKRVGILCVRRKVPFLQKDLPYSSRNGKDSCEPSPGPRARSHSGSCGNSSRRGIS